ncbi:MAG TPA: UrcA family protein [Mycoplana sp.]|nr:UrcA family protein [Mycoplana sp.]
MVTRFKGGMLAVLVGVAASFAVAGSPASAQAVIYVTSPQIPNLRAQRVSYWDLNLATPAGAQTLHRRVGNAVENVCLYDEGRWYGLSVPGYTYCASGAWRRARPQIIGAVHRARQLAYYRGY